MSDRMAMVVGFVVGLACLPLVGLLFKRLTVWVEDGEAAVVTRFGKLAVKLDRPGLHWMPERLFPWVEVHVVSLKRDFRHFQDVHVNDARGTTVIVDLWLELRVEDPVKALFHVADWNASLQNVVLHAATSILGNLEFQKILCDRTELATVLHRDLAQETKRWGVDVELVFIRNVNLLPAVSRQIFETIAARLERAKADIDEAGRLAVAELDASTSVKVAALVAQAKGQYPLAVGRAFATLKADAAVFDAYNELYGLSLVRPHRTVAFRGFADGELRASDAAMIPLTEGAGATIGHEDKTHGPR